MAKPRRLPPSFWDYFRTIAIQTSCLYGVISFGDDVLRRLRRKAEARAEEQLRAEKSK